MQHFSLIGHRSLRSAFFIAILWITVCASFVSSSLPPPPPPPSIATMHTGVSCHDNFKCSKFAVCVEGECKCNLDFKWNPLNKTCEKINCHNNTDCIDPYAQCQLTNRVEWTCHCQNGYIPNLNNNDCVPIPSGNNSGPLAMIIAPIGIGILTAGIIIGVWRYLHKRKMMRRGQIFKTGHLVQLPVGSYPTMANTPTSTGTPTPTGPFHYPAPPTPISAFPHPEGSLSPYHPQQPTPQHQYGSMSYTPQSDFPPPYSPSNAMDCMQAGSSSRPATLDINSSHLMPPTAASSSNNPYSPLSSNKLTLL